jgi:hypothetical protein
VQVDVRLDDVVLRTLEKEPERRYQQASQVKTAVETISSTQPSPEAGAPDVEALRAKLGARDYKLSLVHCLKRAWALLQTDFWRIVGINAIIIVLLWAVGAFPVSFGGHGAIPGSSILSLLLYGPLMGGLYYSYLKRIRGEKVSVETAFSGLGKRFVQLLLGSLVGFLLIGLGLICFVLPGIYFLVCWAYAIPLIIDKELDFWPAMSLSRQMVRKHWWKNLALLIVLAVVHASGLLLFGVGIFLTAPIAIAAFAYAYTDIFASELAQAGTAPAEGTQPVRPPSTPNSGGLGRKVAFAAAAIALLVFVIGVFAHRHHEKRRAQSNRAVAARLHRAAAESNGATEEESAATAGAEASGFFPVQEKTITQGINFKSGELIELPTIADTNVPGSQEVAQTAETVLATARKAEELGIDAYRASDNRGLYVGAGTKFVSLPATNWDVIKAEEVENTITELNTSDGSQVLMRMSTNEAATYAFMTREQVKGVLQIVGTNAEPEGLKIRYKIAREDAPPEAPVAGRQNRLRDRLDAARMMFSGPDRDKALSVIAADAAQARQFEVCHDAIARIFAVTVRDEAVAVSAKTFARQGMQQQAIDLAKGMYDTTFRNRTLGELAR